MGREETTLYYTLDLLRFRTNLNYRINIDIASLEMKGTVCLYIVDI